MSSRWKMNRIGFVNFWLYDEEDFEFEDGKLLLRGQNGSGKSITTQSFIPFVLDGDRTPSRLDPFGSSDRRMEYYFLGEEGRDEATGYLFLEFKKEASDGLKKETSDGLKTEASDEYRTIGIGQRAKRGKPMDFWGFIILDGRRIGYDLWLYKEVGTARIPYDKREMKAQLGEQNIFTDSQSEYKKQVNQYIFGFRKPEQYEQFIKLLVKVRAPKLSKEFKPTKVYEILNDSLQTLTDEDLRAMVDAMEKMDEIQDSLDMLRRAFADVKVIRKEYTRYNQYMLAKKAQAYIAKKQEVEAAQQQIDVQAQKKQEIENDSRNKKQRLEELEEQIKLAETERNGLLDTDLEEIDHKLELAKSQKADAIRHEQRWDDKIQECKERIREGERQLQEIKNRLERRQQELLDEKEELGEQQEILQWEHHEAAVRMIEAESYRKTDEIIKSLDMFKKLIEECKKTIRRYDELSRQYDEAAGQLEQFMKQKTASEQKLNDAQTQVINSIEQWIQGVFDAAHKASEWHPEKEVLEETEEKIRAYQSLNDAGVVQELLRTDYERQRQTLAYIKSEREYELKLKREALAQAEEELLHVKNQEELEPARDAKAEISRTMLKNAGITAEPFYKTVEFSDQLDEKACARLEAQLEKTGILDALVVSSKDFDRIKTQCPDFLDTVLYVKEKGRSSFSGLVVSEALEPGLKETAAKILSHIYEEDSIGQGIYLGKEDSIGRGSDFVMDGSIGQGIYSGEGGSIGQGIYLGKDGRFGHGVLAGKADKDGGAEFVGLLARKRRKEQKIRELQETIREITEAVSNTEKEMAHVQERLEKLQEEYENLPGFEDIHAALDLEKECSISLQFITAEYEKKETQAKLLEEKKNRQYQVVLKQCKAFPYGRTEEAYEEVGTAIEVYRRIWQEIRQILLQIEADKSSCRDKEDRIAGDEQAMDDAFAEKRNYSTKVREFEIQIKQYEDYLNRPDIVEKANRLKQVKEALAKMTSESSALNKEIAVLGERLHNLLESWPKQKERLVKAIGEETCLRNYFEEELALKLVLTREDRTLFDCAKEAVKMLRDGDKNREPGEMLQSLYQIYQRHNGSLASYGTALEECFQTVDDIQGLAENTIVTRKRVRVVSVWTGKKVYMEEFYGILKAAIDETELLIQAKDRELFEDILSQTISQQLTDRIAESKRWVADMSELMKAMDTSMGLSFSLDWKPRKAENDMELDTVELEQILLRDRALLTMEDIEKVAAHFRSKIRTEKQRLEENGSVINYMDLVRDALDYRQWFAFQMYFRRGEEPRKILTNAAFNRFSGGEKAMAMYVPLFAAVNAQYKKAENKDHPRMIALDEAFAGVDDKNISSMFELVHKLDFDYIMNSQALWGCFETVSGLRIAELLRPLNSQTVSVIRYTWNGHERILDVQ
ncbi:MAG: SbcC/MukB-like Walker B domain-containing protein [Lachnospiraceae bacterium]|nr:SbcC/MukB-like Walker B domain-containing protein [Lachnospiraceae bacterium]